MRTQGIKTFLSTKRDTVARHIIRTFRATGDLDVLIEGLSKIDATTRRIVYTRLTETELALLVGGDATAFLASRSLGDLERIALSAEHAEAAYRQWKRWETQRERPQPSIYSTMEQEGNL